MAYWIEHEHLFSGKKYECSNCGAEFDADYDKCPKCGRKMDSAGKYKPDFVDECFFMDMMGK